MNKHTEPQPRPWGVLVALAMGACFWVGVVAGIVSMVGAL